MGRGEGRGVDMRRWGRGEGGDWEGEGGRVGGVRVRYAKWGFSSGFLALGRRAGGGGEGVEGAEGAEGRGLVRGGEGRGEGGGADSLEIFVRSK